MIRRDAPNFSQFLLLAVGSAVITPLIFWLAAMLIALFGDWNSFISMMLSHSSWTGILALYLAGVPKLTPYALLAIPLTVPVYLLLSRFALFRLLHLIVAGGIIGGVFVLLASQFAGPYSALSAPVGYLQYGALMSVPFTVCFWVLLQITRRRSSDGEQNYDG